MKEETLGDSQPSSASLAESSNTFGFQMRQVSCKSSERGASPVRRSIVSRAEDSASRSPGFVLEPMAIAEANSVESADELQSQYTDNGNQTKRRDRRSRRNRTASATSKLQPRLQKSA
jgi:hypothetical protein